MAFASLLVLVSPAHAAGGVDAHRAVASYVAMERNLFDSSTQTYRERFAWPVSQAVSATIAVAQIPGARTDAAAHARMGFRQLAPLRQGSLYRAADSGAIYYDDNEWIAEDMLDWNAFRRDPSAIATAGTIFTGVVGAWDTDAATPCAGGVYWTTDPAVRDRNTVSTANGALVGLRLYALTHRPMYLEWSKRMLDWVNACMLSANGLYWDHISTDGAVDESQWSYNQGALVGAYLTLYETTHDASALARAEQIADASLAAFTGDRLASEPPAFAAILFDRLLELAAVDGRTQYVAAAESYADAAWNSLRDPQTGLFRFDGSTDLLGQAAFVQLYAHLALTGTAAAARRSPPPATAPTARESHGAHEDRGQAPPGPRTPPAQAGRSDRLSRTSR